MVVCLCSRTIRHEKGRYITWNEDFRYVPKERCIYLSTDNVHPRGSQLVIRHLIMTGIVVCVVFFLVIIAAFGVMTVVI